MAVAAAGDGASYMISCAVRSDGSVVCRVGREDGSWAVLEDGGLGPRYREVEVLVFGRAGVTWTVPGLVDSWGKS